MSDSEAERALARRGPESRCETSRLSEDDVYLFREGSHFNLHEHLGAHPATLRGTAGTHFAVWAPRAERVAVVGSFNSWDARAHPLEARGTSGIWEGFAPGVGHGSVYKFHIEANEGRRRVDKCDPFAFWREMPPRTASVVWTLEHEWNDGEWMAERKRRNALDAPISIYELHLGSWRRSGGAGGSWLSYRELADELVPYLQARGFTHAQFMPICEHPFFGSWGYQATGYFAPTSRYGTPQDLMQLVDRLHQAGIGVILDWVPSHFPTDEHGLSYFDGTHLYEHPDPRRGFHPDWQSYVFDYGRPEVQSFLVSSALFWLSKYHFDGLRVDAVASMLYLDYSRKEGEWLPNVHGGRENLEAIAFLKRLNEAVYAAQPDVQTIAEESTSWPLVSRPIHLGGLGFGLKWDMGWMNDTLRYFARDPLFRQFHHREVTFRSMYAAHENWVLALSHDEVVHGKRSLVMKMPGDEWQKLANLRLLLAYQYALPGKKLLFMGTELAQIREWDHEGSLDWALIEREGHAGVQRLVDDLNRLYVDHAELHERDTDARGFEWVDADDLKSSVLSFLRLDARGSPLLVVLNMTPLPRPGYRVGVSHSGLWRELLNSDAARYGGSAHPSESAPHTQGTPCHGRPDSLLLTLPPLGALFLLPEPPAAPPRKPRRARRKKPGA